MVILPPFISLHPYNPNSSVYILKNFSTSSMKSVQGIDGKYIISKMNIGTAIADAINPNLQKINMINFVFY